MMAVSVSKPITLHNREAKAAMFYLQDLFYVITIAA